MTPESESVVRFILKFITGVAWIWGSLLAVGVLNAAAIGTDRSSHDAARYFAAGIPAWAWLLARYLL